MDESEKLSGDPARLLLSEMSRAALRMGNFQLAFLIDTSTGEICRQLWRELDEFEKFMTIFMQEPGPSALAA